MRNQCVKLVLASTKGNVNADLTVHGNPNTIIEHPYHEIVIGLMYAESEKGVVR